MLVHPAEVAVFALTQKEAPHVDENISGPWSPINSETKDLGQDGSWSEPFDNAGGNSLRTAINKLQFTVPSRVFKSSA